MDINESKLKQQVQRKVLILSSLILVAKFTAYFLTNSVGVLTDAMESIVNVAAGAISLLCLYFSARPQDETHPFGHGKAELISASIEGLLIIIAGGIIIWKGAERLCNPDEIQKLDIGIYIVAASGVLNYLAGRYSVKVGQKHNSMSLIAEGKHLQSDTYSSIGLLVGLALLYLTDLQWIDSAMAIVFGTVIIVTGISILKKTTDNLLDKADLKLLEDLAKTLDEEKTPEWIDIHNTKILKYGSYFYMDCDLTLPWFYNIRQGHKIGRDLQKILKARYSNNILMNVHLDPCDIFEEPKCYKCQEPNCPDRQSEFKGKEKISINTFIRKGVEVRE